MGFNSSQQRHGSNKKSGYDPNYKPTPGSVLPGKIKDELKEMDTDDQDTRKFTKKYVNKFANRKEQRKQKRSEKGQRRQEYHQHMQTRINEAKRKNHPQQQQQPQDAKRQKTTSATILVKKATPPATTVKTSKKPTKSNEQALKDLSHTNPHLYALLDANDLLHDKSSGKNNETGDSRVNNAAFAEDNQYIAYWEKKLKWTRPRSLDRRLRTMG
ncbi:unnamed protein product [Absidia cylindrospora]